MLLGAEGTGRPHPRLQAAVGLDPLPPSLMPGVGGSGGLLRSWKGNWPFGAKFCCTAGFPVGLEQEAVPAANPSRC